MNTKRLSEKALSVIDQYENFRIGSLSCSIPYFINRHLKLRAGLRAGIGKGSPKDIFDEVESIGIKERIDFKNLTNENFKKFLVDHDIGIDCSGLAYYILSAESESRGKKSLDRHLSFPLSKGIVRKILSKMRPVENTGVTTLAHDLNSKVLTIKQAEPGDIITMVSEEENGKRNHILVIHQIEYQNFIPTTIHYTHAIAWPTDGEYGHGVREGSIEILDPNKQLIEQKWIELDKVGNDNYTFTRAQKSRTELRRLNWF